MTTRTEAIAKIIDPMSMGLEGVFDGPVQVGNCERAREKARAIEALLGLDEVEAALRSIVFYEADDFPERGDICEHYFPLKEMARTALTKLKRPTDGTV